MRISAISWQQTIPVRQRVLWPDKAQEFCYIDGDADAMHYGAFIDGQLVYCFCFFNSGEACLRKFATDTNYQNQGVGSVMLAHITQSLKSRQIACFWCDARASALGFYERFGMQPSGVSL